MVARSKSSVAIYTIQENCLYAKDKNYTVSQEFPDSVKNMLLLKNPQFLPYDYETRSKLITYEN